MSHATCRWPRSCAGCSSPGRLARASRCPALRRSRSAMRWPRAPPRKPSTSCAPKGSSVRSRDAGSSWYRENTEAGVGRGATFVSRRSALCCVPTGPRVRSGEHAYHRSERGLDVGQPLRFGTEALGADLPAAVDVARFRQGGDGAAARLGAGDGGGGGGGDVHGLLPSLVRVAGGGGWFVVGSDAGRHAGGEGRSATGRPGWPRAFSAGQERTAPAKPAPSRPRSEKDLGRLGRAQREAGCAPARACETDQVGIRRGPRHRGLPRPTGSAGVTTAYAPRAPATTNRTPQVSPTGPLTWSVRERVNAPQTRTSRRTPASPRPPKIPYGSGLALGVRAVRWRMRFLSSPEVSADILASADILVRGPKPHGPRTRKGQLSLAVSGPGPTGPVPPDSAGWAPAGSP